MNVWPNDRRINEIAQLHAYNTKEQLEAQTANQLDIIGDLPPYPLIIDLGMGEGNFLIELAEILKHKTVLVGVSASPCEVKEEQCRAAKITIVKGQLPDDPAVSGMLVNYRQHADRIFDTYGPATYAHNPLHSLLFSALLLKKEGHFSAISSTDNKFHTVFGDHSTHQKIIAFFKEELEIDLTFQFSAIYSRVNPGQIHTDLLINFRGSPKLLAADDYSQLCQKADQMIGIPEISSPGWYEYRGFTITPREYNVLPAYQDEQIQQGNCQ